MTRYWRLGRLQILLWHQWQGIRIYRWEGNFSRFFSISLYMGWVEIRVWQR